MVYSSTIQCLRQIEYGNHNREIQFIGMQTQLKVQLIGGLFRLPQEHIETLESSPNPVKCKYHEIDRFA